ncbi:MAG: YceI family protein [Cytophagaceae bacterium]
MKTLAITSLVLFASVMMAFTLSVNEYRVDTKQSSVNWIGRKVIGEHSGNIKISDGKFITDGKKITGGVFSIDMTSIKCTDLKDKETNAKLVGHLNSEDFFSTAAHPKATLEVKEVTSTGTDTYSVKGDLTIKGITKPIEFPATIKILDNKINATAKILVDRTQYEIKYGSGSFFDGLGDKAINNTFELNVSLVASK